MDFNLSEEQVALQRLARDFAEREIRPVANELDKKENPADCFPWEIVRKGSKLGLRTLPLPEEYGGIGAGALTQSIVIQEIARVDPGAAAVFAQCWKITQMIYKAGTEDQRQRFLIPFAQDDECVCSMLTTEPGAGADNHLPYDDPKGGLTLSAIRQGDHYILNGMKHFCSLVGFSKLMLVFARTNKTVGVTKGTTCFILHRDTPGVSFGRVHDKMGWRLFPNGETYFDNVRLPMENRLGDEGMAYPQVRWYFGKTVETPSFALGVARAAYERALEHARERVQGGVPIIQHQAVGLALAEMKMLIEASQSFLWRAGWSIDNDPNYTPAIAIHCKAFVTEAALKVAQKAMFLFGASGIMRDLPMEKYTRDLLCMFHTDGGRDIGMLKSVAYL